MKHATLVIPFVELNDFAPSTTVDLRTAPLDVELGGHHFRVVAVEPYGDDQRRIVLELPVSGATPRFVQPARVHGADPEFGWQRHAFDANAPGRPAIWMQPKSATRRSSRSPASCSGWTDPRLELPLG